MRIDLSVTAFAVPPPLIAGEAYGCNGNFRKEKGTLNEEHLIRDTPVIGTEQVRALTAVLQKYKTGKVQTERRILASENWWKLRNAMEEQQLT